MPAVKKTMSQWAWTEKERSLLIMAPSILSHRLQEFGLEQERIADRDCLALANARQNLQQPIVALAKRNWTPCEAVLRANEHDARFADGLDGAYGHRHRHRALPDRYRSLDQRARAPVAVGIGDLGHHARRMGLLLHDRADEDDLAEGAFCKSVGGNRRALPFGDGRKTGRTD